MVINQTSTRPGATRLKAAHITEAIDLFADLDGWSTGARAARVQALSTANRWSMAVERLRH